MKDNIHCELLSERNLLIRFGDTISEELLETIKQAQHCAQKVFGRQLKDMIPSYTTLLIEFDPVLISPRKAQLNFQKAWIKHECTEHLPTSAKQVPASVFGQSAASQIEPCIEIPVYYHPSVAWDLESVAQQHSLSWQQVADIHSQRSYRVYALGFAPGFAFMGQLDPRLATARKTRPRTYVPAGSVAIADLQTAVYPQESPGGWNIIGRSPCELFKPERSPANLLKTADRVRFKAIDKQQFLELGGCLEHHSRQAHD